MVVESRGGLVGVDGAGRGCRLEDRGRRTVMGCQWVLVQPVTAALIKGTPLRGLQTADPGPAP